MGRLAEVHRRRFEEYYHNALEYMGRGDFPKASEFMWGAITQTLKALAAIRGYRIITHKDFFEFMRLISKELGDEELYKKFLLLNNLHRNFYEEYIDPRDFPIYYKEAELFLRRIWRIAKEIEELRKG
ncbi:PaREP1/PaREP8 domain containing family protein [Staphylothermus marinus F1]|uniref:PaREP1/PaREP8 domain containing family protein n=1 Tax=Staphylothermus marinus (strain ATCC 43588 / DSM 3639 / JCM 9404 / F1) TaxID=399550 RepID=A3DPR1_STAMF|nr:PaREP1/PaREP8 domain-contain protein [Staphylothermus marinus]ABN70621.1 PaREP1/PaREP8 domain containing family protein [Staphylothermus marinus F1]